MKFIILALLGCVLAVNATVNLRERYSWNAIDFAYPDDFSRQRALLTREFVPENNLPVGIEVWRNKLFVTVPRWKEGIPATLNYIRTDVVQGSNPKLIPYPSWEGNQLGNCDSGLTTVYRIKADACGRLWVLDTGTYGIGNTTTNPCPYTLNVFDLNTDRIIRKYVFRPEDTNAHTFIANIAVDVGATCDDAYAYFSDELGYGLVVYSWEQNTSWRFGHGFMLPNPLLGEFSIAGLDFQWYEEGIFGMALSATQTDGFKTLYFSPIASHTEFAVSTKVLRDSNRVSDSYQEFQVVGTRGEKGHLTSKAMNDDGLMLFNLIDQNAIGCWNSRLPYRLENHVVVDKDDVSLVFPSDVKFDNSGNVWVISDRMPVFLEAELDYTDVNFRIFSAPVSEMVQGTVCETRNKLPTVPSRYVPVYANQVPTSFFSHQVPQRISHVRPYWPSRKQYHVYEPSYSNALIKY